MHPIYTNYQANGVAFCLETGLPPLCPPEPLLHLLAGQLYRHRPAVGTVFAPRRSGPPGAPNIFASSGQMNCPCGKVLLRKTLGRAKGAMRGQMRSGPPGAPNISASSGQMNCPCGKVLLRKTLGRAKGAMRGQMRSGPPGAPNIFASSAGVNPACGKVLLRKTLGRAKGAMRGQIMLSRTASPAAAGSALSPPACRGDSI